MPAPQQHRNTVVENRRDAMSMLVQLSTMHSLSLLLACCCLVGTSLALSAADGGQTAALHAAADPREVHAQVAASGDDLVPLDLFIMSKCPDAIACEALLDNILAGSIGNYVTIRPNYIANIDSRPTTCKHGQSECAGDAQQLCVLKFADAYAFWDFVKCQNQNVTAIGETSWADFCLQQLDASDVALRRAKTCYSGSDAESLLRNNVHKTLQSGVRSSCSIWVNSEPKDWRDQLEGEPGTQDFVDAICNAYHAKNKIWPPGCRGAGTIVAATA